MEYTQIAVMGCTGTRPRGAKAVPCPDFGPLAWLLESRPPMAVIVACDDHDAEFCETADGVVSAFPGTVRTEMSAEGYAEPQKRPSCKEPVFEASKVLRQLSIEYAGSSVFIVGKSDFVTASFFAFGHLSAPPGFNVGDHRTSLSIWGTRELLAEPVGDEWEYWYPPRWSLMFFSHWPPLPGRPHQQADEPRRIAHS